MDLDTTNAVGSLSHSEVPSRFSDRQRKEYVERLPSLTEEDLASVDQKDSSCPICLTPFLAILASEKMATAMESRSTSTEKLGVTRLTCGHVFCRKDIVTWIQQHDACPICRRSIFEHSVPTGCKTSPTIQNQMEQIRRMLDHLQDEVEQVRRRMNHNQDELDQLQRMVNDDLG